MTTPAARLTKICFKTACSRMFVKNRKRETGLICLSTRERLTVGFLNIKLIQVCFNVVEGKVVIVVLGIPGYSCL